MRHLYGVALFCTLCSLALSETVFTHRSSLYNAQSLHAAASSIDNRIDSTLHHIRKSIPSAVTSIESDIASSNLRSVIIGTMNLLGAAFGFRGAIGDNLTPEFTLRQLSFGDQLNALSQAMYGFGYVGVFYFELEEARLDCGVYDFDRVLHDYSFVSDFPSIYGHSYSPSSSDTDPHLLQYYVVEMKNRLKKAIYCITSRRGSNQEAYVVDSFINLYAKLATERLSLTDGILRASNSIDSPLYKG
eukprot:TRINITY_DN494_c0_g1_i1.p1 TRINITY_DN494_c0_g1~~TRINITY_DN494_c0_g1_i1.p1  ORF type:complete len:245 (+),score=44.34 TRINITY_DN494_c0_g1_i1:291-1025(+)